MSSKPRAAKREKPGKSERAAKTRDAKATRAGRERAATVQASWLTPEGYRLAGSLAALDPAAVGGERIVSLANQILDQHVRLGRRALAVCAAATGAGVSFVAANLAIALAQAGVEVLLVDTNFDAPALQNLIAPPQEGPGLRELLADPEMDMLTAVHADVLPGLSIIYSGGEGDGGGDLLLTERFEAMARRCLRDFGLTIFDTAPANRSTGARTTSVAAGYALLVARRDASFADDVVTLAEQLDQDGVLVIGSVLNGV